MPPEISPWLPAVSRRGWTGLCRLFRLGYPARSRGAPPWRPIGEPPEIRIRETRCQHRDKSRPSRPLRPPPLRSSGGGTAARPRSRSAPARPPRPASAACWAA